MGFFSRLLSKIRNLNSGKSNISAPDEIELVSIAKPTITVEPMELFSTNYTTVSIPVQHNTIAPIVVFNAEPEVIISIKDETIILELDTTVFVDPGIIAVPKSEVITIGSAAIIQSIYPIVPFSFIIPVSSRFISGLYCLGTPYDRGKY